MKCTEFMLALDVQQLVFRAKHRARNVMQKNHMKSNVQKPHTNHRMHAWCVALNAIKIILFKCWNHFSSPRAHFSLTCFAVSHLRTYFRVAVVHFVVSFCKLSFTYLLFFFPSLFYEWNGILHSNGPKMLFIVEKSTAQQSRRERQFVDGAQQFICTLNSHSLCIFQCIQRAVCSVYTPSNTSILSPVHQKKFFIIAFVSRVTYYMVRIALHSFALPVPLLWLL